MVFFPFILCSLSVWFTYPLFRFCCCPSPFWKIFHGAQEWCGWRACIAAYVDTNTLQFFESYKLVDPVLLQVVQPYNNLVTVNGKQCFAFREKKEAEENWEMYDKLTAAV